MKHMGMKSLADCACKWFFAGCQSEAKKPYVHANIERVAASREISSVHAVEWRVCLNDTNKEYRVPKQVSYFDKIQFGSFILTGVAIAVFFLITIQYVLWFYRILIFLFNSILTTYDISNIIVKLHNLLFVEV